MRPIRFTLNQFGRSILPVDLAVRTQIHVLLGVLDDFRSVSESPLREPRFVVIIADVDRGHDGNASVPVFPEVFAEQSWLAHIAFIFVRGAEGDVVIEEGFCGKDGATVPACIYL